MSSRPLVLFVAVATLLVTANAEAGRRCWGGWGGATFGPSTCAPATCAPATCAPATCAPATCAPKICYQQVQRTVLVPTVVTEMRTICVTKCRPEVRQYTYTVMRQVPETREIPYEYTVMVPEQRVRTEQYTVCVPVQRVVEQPYTVMVPEQRVRTEQYTVCVPVQRVVEQPYTVMVPTTETRTATRTVCKMVPETVMKTVYECAGHWEERCIEQPVTCAPATCAPATCAPVTCAPKTYRVWVPEMIAKQVPVTCMKPAYFEEQYNYCVTVCRPEQRVQQVTICEYKQECRTREVPFTV